MRNLFSNEGEQPMERLVTSKSPVRDYRKAVVAVMVKYFEVDPRTLRFKANALRSHRAQGDSPAYVALSAGQAFRLPLAQALRKQGVRRTR